MIWIVGILAGALGVGFVLSIPEQAWRAMEVWQTIIIGFCVGSTFVRFGMRLAGDRD
jgi:hypothetical protein